MPRKGMTPEQGADEASAEWSRAPLPLEMSAHVGSSSQKAPVEGPVSARAEWSRAPLPLREHKAIRQKINLKEIRTKAAQLGSFVVVREKKESRKEKRDRQMGRKREKKMGVNEEKEKIPEVMEGRSVRARSDKAVNVKKSHVKEINTDQMKAELADRQRVVRNVWEKEGDESGDRGLSREDKWATSVHKQINALEALGGAFFPSEISFELMTQRFSIMDNGKPKTLSLVIVHDEKAVEILLADEKTVPGHPIYQEFNIHLVVSIINHKVVMEWLHPTSVMPLHVGADACDLSIANIHAVILLHSLLQQTHGKACLASDILMMVEWHKREEKEKKEKEKRRKEMEKMYPFKTQAAQIIPVPVSRECVMDVSTKEERVEARIGLAETDEEGSEEENERPFQINKRKRRRQGHKKRPAKILKLEHPVSFEDKSRWELPDQAKEDSTKTVIDWPTKRRITATREELLRKEKRREKRQDKLDWKKRITERLSLKKKKAMETECPPIYTLSMYKKSLSSRHSIAHHRQLKRLQRRRRSVGSVREKERKERKERKTETEEETRYIPAIDDATLDIRRL